MSEGRSCLNMFSYTLYSAKSSRGKSSRRESIKKKETEMDVIRRLQEKSPSGIKGLAFVVREVKKA